MLDTQVQTTAFKAKMQKVNEWGNAWSGLIAAVGLVATVLILAKQVKRHG